MIGMIFRLALAFTVAAVIVLMFVYAFMAALIVAPIVILLLFLFGKKTNTTWVMWGQESPRENPRSGPVIDHDPDALRRPPAHDTED